MTKPNEEAKQRLLCDCELRYSYVDYIAVEKEIDRLMDVVSDIPNVSQKETLDCLVREVRQKVNDIVASLIKIGDSEWKELQ